MTENVNLTLKPSRSVLGKIQITPRVLEIIVSIAAMQVKGVNRMQNSFTNGVNELLGRQEWGKGIKLAFNHHRLIVDLDVFINYGYSVPQVAFDVQKKVRQQLYFMTGLKVGLVNVHVNGMVPGKKVRSPKTRQLFHDRKGDQH